MKLLGLTSLGTISAAVLSLVLLAGAPVYAQEQHDQEEKQAQPEEKRPEQEKSIKPEEKSAQQDKNTKQEGKNAQQQDKNNGQEQKSAQQHTPQEQRAGGNGGGRIPDDRYRANFGREHTFRVSQGDYGNRRFQYGGYWFGFVGVWPSNWLYTQNVYVIDINGVYYLCNPVYPGVNIALSVTL
jgi:hypothetical protein